MDDPQELLKIAQHHCQAILRCLKAYFLTQTG
jgi:hypothetical protein